MKKSFFGRYYLYKLKNLRGFLIANFILSAAGMPAVVSVLKFIADIYIKTAETGNNSSENLYEIMFGLSILSLSCLPAILLALIAISAILPVVNFKHYNSRVFVDTIGSLPLTYTERFFGDFLSGLTASAAPFALFIPYILIMSADIRKCELFPHAFAVFSQYAVIYLIILVSAYAFSTFVTSCCGKIGSSLFYSLFGMVFIPGIVVVYSSLIYSYVVGVDVLDSFFDTAKLIAPLGTTIDFISFWFGFADTMFSENADFSPLPLPLYFYMLILPIIYGVGAYFLGKYRKAERVGRDFVYEGSFTVFSVFLFAIIFGLFLSSIAANNPTSSVITIAVFGIILCFAVELSHSRKLKNLPKALIKYAAVGAVCLGFFGITHATKGFGLSEVIPSADEVSRVEIKGSYLFSYNHSALVYDDKAAIESIISEHKTLLSDKSKIETGSEIVITYKLKSGFEIKRQYCSANGSGLIKSVSEKIGELPTSSANVYGILNSTDYTDLSFIGSYYIPTTEDDTNATIIQGEYMKCVEFVIKPSKVEEFRKILLEDIKKYYSIELEERGTFNIVTAVYKRNGIEYKEYYRIYEPYKATMAFIQNPENCADNVNSSPSVDYYIEVVISESGEENGYIGLDLNSDSESAKELISMFVIGNGKEVSEKINIRDSLGMSYKIRKSDEKRAVEIIMKIIGENI